MPRLYLQKYYIYVLYKDKDKAKNIGAKCCSESKKLYVPSNADLKKFSKCFYPQNNTIDINEVYNQFSKAYLSIA